MRIRTFLKPFSFLPAIILMVMIYSFSAQEGNISSSVSYKASTILVKAADNLFDMGLDDYQVSYYATKINGVTRKLAHMTEYFLLAIAVSFPLYVYGLHGILLMLLAGGLCIAFACGDEYHQSFVAGRSPSSRDVLIDGIGVFLGIIVVRIIGWTGRMTIFRPVKSKEGKLTRKEKKQLKMQQKAMENGYDLHEPKSAAGYGAEGMWQNGPYPEGSHQKGSYQNVPYPNGPYPGGSYPNGSQPNAAYGNGPYANGNYQTGSSPNGPYQNGPYQNGPYQNGPYQNGPYQNGPYQNGGYPNGSYPGGPQAGTPGQPYYGSYPQPPQYGDDPEDHSSDELAEDMPLSHLLKPKK